MLAHVSIIFSMTGVIVKNQVFTQNPCLEVEKLYKVEAPSTYWRSCVKNTIKGELFDTLSFDLNNNKMNR